MSFSKVDAKVVRRACLAYLSRRDTNIKKRREKLIEKEMKEQEEQQNRKLREIKRRTKAIRERYGIWGGEGYGNDGALQNARTVRHTVDVYGDLDRCSGVVGIARR